MFWLKFLILLGILLNCVSAFEWPIITYRSSESCTKNETYNPSMLHCSPCSSSNSEPSSSGNYWNCLKSRNNIRKSKWNNNNKWKESW